MEGMLTEQEQKLLDDAAAAVGPIEAPKRKPKKANEAEEVKADLDNALTQAEADDVEARLPTHGPDGKKLSPKERRVSYLMDLTGGEIRGIKKLSIAKLDAKIKEIEDQLAGGDEEEEAPPEQGEEIVLAEEEPKLSLEEVRDGAKFCAQLAAQGLLIVEKATHQTCGTTGVDCTGAYVIYQNNPIFQQHAEKGWEKLLADNPKLVQKILGPWFYLGNAYLSPCAMAATENLRNARIAAMKQ